MNAAELARAVRPGDAVALAVVLGLFGLSIAVYDAVPAEMVVHYTPPGTVYYGPETLPKAVGLFLVPTLALVTYVVLRLPLPAESLAFGAIRPFYLAGVVAVVALFGVTHVALVLITVT